MRRRTVVFFFFGCVALVAALALWQQPEILPTAPDPRLPPESFAQPLKDHLERSEWPTELALPTEAQPLWVKVTYSIEPAAQSYIQENLRRWSPDYAAFVALDAETGRLIAMASYQKRKQTELGHLALRATYPAASVFKMVTAAAAIEHKDFSSSSTIPFTGSYHTLYRRNVLRESHPRWTRSITLREAFAKSINSVFGKIGVFHLGTETLARAADRFMFNQKIQTDIPMQLGSGEFTDLDPWSVAEIASGFTRSTTLNPIQGAMMAAAVINDGVMMTPYLIENAQDKEGNVVYKSEPRIASQAMSNLTARRLRELMRETVVSGTSAKAFRRFRRNQWLSEIEVGGKTGSLTGFEPRGKYDWYVGYAKLNNRSIALAALTINEDQWRVKSAQLASDFVDQYFRSFSRSAKADDPRRPSSNRRR